MCMCSWAQGGEQSKGFRLVSLSGTWTLVPVLRTLTPQSHLVIVCLRAGIPCHSRIFHLTTMVSSGVPSLLPPGAVLPAVTRPRPLLLPPAPWSSALGGVMGGGPATRVLNFAPLVFFSAFLPFQVTFSFRWLRSTGRFKISWKKW